MGLMEKYVESERIKAIETFIKAFKDTATYSESTMCNTNFYTIREPDLTKLEEEYMERRYGKK